MRRFRTITLALCAMALAMGGTSCKKEKENNVQSGDRMVIGANIEQGGSKTHIGSEIDGQFPVLWSADDSFTLYAKENTTGSTFTIQEGGADKTSAQFEGEKPEGNAPYFAMYPTSGRYSGNKVFTYDIPAIQNSENIEHAGPMVGYSADGKNVSFQNAASWIRIGLKGTAKVAKVVLTYKTSSKPVGYPALSGRLQITVKDDGTIEDTEIVPIGPAKDDVPTLTLEKTAELGDDYTYFGFLVPERAFGAPAVFTVLDANGKTLATIEKSIPSVERGKVYVSVYGTAIAPAPTLPDGALSGLFTVSDSGTPGDASDDVKVYFSKGNLTYNVSTTAWAFYEHQYDCASAYDANLISLFNWGYNAVKSIIPDGSFKDNVARVSGELTQTEDWGCTIGDGKTWRTLTKAEWQYLFNTRTMANGGARFENLTSSGITVEGVTFKGVVLFPDDFTDQADWKTKYTTWKALNDAGIVFLPAAGYRNASSVVTGIVFYWSSSAYNGTTAYNLDFSSSNENLVYNKLRKYGLSVRLITEAK